MKKTKVLSVAILLTVIMLVKCKPAKEEKVECLKDSTVVICDSDSVVIDTLVVTTLTSK